MEEEQLIQLLERISHGEPSDEDIRQYSDWCNEFQKKALFIEDFDQIKASMLAEIEKRVRQDSLPVRKIRLWPRIAVAASFILVLLAGGYVFWHQPTKPLEASVTEPDVAPGGNRAFLTLGNGQKILLDSMHNGNLTRQAGSNVSKPQNGLLVYRADKNSLQRTQYNTLSTPRGGQYKLVLPDSSIVWLNAASSIRYPTAFNGSERTVAITGEVYFEVVHNDAKPFAVTVMGQTIEDLGTKFDVNAYGDEPVIKTTLIHGSVRITKGGRQVVLKPGQQAVVSSNGNDIKVQHVNTDNAIAWINGFMSLEHISVKEFMNHLSRWYNVDIEYSGEVPDKKFGGMINRDAGLPDVLSVLSASGIHTKLEGRKIIVLPD